MKALIIAAAVLLSGCQVVVKKELIHIDVSDTVMAEPRAYDLVPKDADYEKLLATVIRNNTNGVLNAEQLRTLQTLIRTHNSVIEKANKK